jgi:hypothetical protein
MKPRTILLAGGAILLIAAGVMLVPRSKDTPPAAEPSRTEQTAAVSSKSGARESDAAAKPEGEAKPAAISDEERMTILNGIEQASVTYDAKALADIEPYLLHPDAEVRQAAMNGMIVLGDAAAGPLLRKAAEKAPTPKEAVALTEAAEYIELPAGTFVPKDRVTPGNRIPAQGKPAERSRPRLTPRPAPQEAPPPAAE